MLVFWTTFAFSLAVTFAQMRVGGYSKANLKRDDPVIQFSLDSINNLYASKGDDVPRTLTTIRRVNAKTVSGVLYDIELLVFNGIKFEKCTLEVWARIWLPSPEDYTLKSGPLCTA